MRFIDRIKSVLVWTPKTHAVDLGRRRFLRHIVSATAGVLALPPAAILLPKKTIVTVPAMSMPYLDTEIKIGMSLKEEMEILQRAWYTFTFSGNRPYITMSKA